jgi:hypothetical protein
MVLGMRERTDPTKLAMLRRIPVLRSTPDADLEAAAEAVGAVAASAPVRPPRLVRRVLGLDAAPA